MPVIGFILFFLFGIAQLIAGYVGIDYHFGVAWAIAALIASLMFRFTLPITIGAFFGAMDVWGWSWVLSLVFVAPGVAFLIPGFILSMFEAIKK
ncbi:hypothetical protein [Endozoicomonas euniceicola]|uniref:Major facilitator superfamily (MFS) profile domain-containing protein n=1 Tax=Endozoicomonas euniceicola TaxID=1234143 RepID=A0ABY6GU38_9GAMM|nr:hypothetical protein [Endozoicomonas euniceicola]UYM16293.1 hypothetical protein NX720_26445 [Endozoicomonas euniceicola]